MKKEFRVRKNEEFGNIIAGHHRLINSSFTVYYLRKKLDHCRAGISVSKKLGNAVVRNKIKRQLRMMVLSLVDFDNYPFDLIIVVRNGYLKKSFDDNQKDLEKLFKKAIIEKYD